MTYFPGTCMIWIWIIFPFSVLQMKLLRELIVFFLQFLLLILSFSENSHLQTRKMKCYPDSANAHFSTSGPQTFVSDSCTHKTEQSGDRFCLLSHIMMFIQTNFMINYSKNSILLPNPIFAYCSNHASSLSYGMHSNQINHCLPLKKIQNHFFVAYMRLQMKISGLS